MHKYKLEETAKKLIYATEAWNVVYRSVENFLIKHFHDIAFRLWINRTQYSELDYSAFVSMYMPTGFNDMDVDEIWPDLEKNTINVKLANYYDENIVCYFDIPFQAIYDEEEFMKRVHNGI